MFFYHHRQWCEVDGVVRLSLRPESYAGATGRCGRSGGACKREELTVPDVRLPRTEPSKSADGGGGGLFFLWSSGRQAESEEESVTE
jgi:hypothetical protein